jgi:hypothetical protein
LSRRCGELFAVENEVLLYDVTSTYFEGQAEANPLARRGYSRDHRPDCKQVCIALVVTFDGFPLGYEVFAGNTHDSRTLQTIVATMEARHGMLGRVWISDRGMASTDNLAWLRSTGRRYIIGAPKSELKKFSSALAAADGWRTVHEGVEVKPTRHPETEETVIPCRSADRRSKEQAMHDKFSQRIEEALQRLAARLARAKKRVDPAVVNRQIGRILQQNQRSAARFAITLEPDGCPAGFRLGVIYNDAFDDWAAISEGAYLLRSNIDDWSDQQLWKAYIQLTQAEAAFRIQKDQLNLRRSGTSVRIACRHISSSAFSPSYCGRASRCGRAALVSAIPQEPCSKSSRAFSRMMSCCQPPPTARYVCVVSPNPMPHRPLSSTASA